MRVLFYDDTRTLISSFPIDGLLTIRPTGRDRAVFGTTPVPDDATTVYVGTTRYDLTVDPFQVGSGLVVMPDATYDETWDQIQQDMTGAHDEDVINGRIELMEVELVARHEASSQ